MTPRTAKNPDAPVQQPAEATSMARVSGGVLELVSETVDQEIDVAALHDALAALLVRRYRRTVVSQAPAG